MAQVLDHINTEDIVSLSLKVSGNGRILLVDRLQCQLPHLRGEYACHEGVREGADSTGEEAAEVQREATEGVEPEQSEERGRPQDSSSQAIMRVFVAVVMLPSLPPAPSDFVALIGGATLVPIHLSAIPICFTATNELESCTLSTDTCDYSLPLSPRHEAISILFFADYLLPWSQLPESVSCTR